MIIVKFVLLSKVCNTTALPKPRGIYKPLGMWQRNNRKKKPTILNQDWIGPESSLILYIKTAPINGNTPKIKLIVLYLPVACIIHPVKTEPIDIERLFGNRWRPNFFWLDLTKIKQRVNHSHTSCGCVGQHDCLKPHREEIHDRKIAHWHEEVRCPDQEWYFLFEKGRGKDRFRCNENFNNEKENGEYAC